MEDKVLRALVESLAGMLVSVSMTLATTALVAYDEMTTVIGIMAFVSFPILLVDIHYYMIAKYK